MAAAVAIERLQGAVELKCSCCLQYFTDPVRLRGCGHSFCRACISRYCRSRQDAGCPLCRLGFELRDLQPNRELAALVSLIPQWVKEEDLETRDEPRPSRAAACNDQNSAGLRPREKEYASQIKSQITEDFRCMKEYVERQERNTLIFIEQEQKAAQQKIEETVHQLSVEGSNLTDIKEQTNPGVGDERNRYLRSMSHLAYFKLQPNEINRAFTGCFFPHTIKNNLPDRQRYKGSPSTGNKITLDEKLNVVKSLVEDLKRELEILLLEKYGQQFPPVQLPDLHQETSVRSLSPESAAKNPEPVVSSPFWQWADDVTFDLARVYERLAITAQKRKVMVSSSPTNYGPSPNRFCISQVMCSQSFSTGCHYWEVITKDSDGWAVGVAHEMIGKRDKLGRTEHSWCVEWLGPKKQLSAWHRDQETLLHKDKPLKVGVFLELQKKTVSFYSINDKEILLHTFEVNTTNPLYPAFWLYSLQRDGSLTLSHADR